MSKSNSESKFELTQPRAMIIAALLTGVAGVIIAGLFQNYQARIPIKATQTAEAKMAIVQPTNTRSPDTLSPVAIDQEAKSETEPTWKYCQSFGDGETRQVSPGTFVIGDVSVNDVPEYTSRDMEGLIVFFETEASVTAPWGANCIEGSKSLLDELVQNDLENGCGSSCVAVQAVIFGSDGQKDIQFYSK